MKLKLLGTEKEPLSLKLGDNIKVDLGSRIFKPLNVTENGTYIGGQEDGMLVGFTPVTVNVPSVEPKIEPLEVTENGVYNSNELDGYKPVTVNVKSTIEPLTVTENGTYNSEEVDGYKPVVVDVPVPSDTTAQVGDILEGKTAYIEGLKQTGILKAKKFTTGTVTFATATANPVITHNLGVKPTTFIIYVSDETVIPESGSSEAKGSIWGGFANHLVIGDRRIVYNIYAMQGNTSTGVYSWQHYIQSIGDFTFYQITETTIKMGGSNTNYKYQPNHEYTWIAIE